MIVKVGDKLQAIVDYPDTADMTIGDVETVTKIYTHTIRTTTTGYSWWSFSIRDLDKKFVLYKKKGKFHR